MRKLLLLILTLFIANMAVMAFAEGPTVYARQEV